MAAENPVKVTLADGTVRDATPKEAAQFHGFCAHMDAVERRLRKAAKLPGWTWDHTGGGICLAYLPVTLKEPPACTGEADVSLSLGSEGVELLPFRREALDDDPHRRITLPDGEQIEINDAFLSEYGLLGNWDERYWGRAVYSKGWTASVRAWCRAMIASPDPDKVADDVLAITKAKAL